MLQKVLCLFLMSLFFCHKNILFAGTSPGKISCSKADFSFEGVVPADSAEINVLVKSKLDSVVLLDDLSFKQLDSNKKEEIKAIPLKLVIIGEDKSPFDGKYLLKVHEIKDKLSYLNIIATSKKPVKFLLPTSTEFSFSAKFEFKLNEFSKGKKVQIKDVSCNWTYKNP